jgi:hypothetical protein
LPCFYFTLCIDFHLGTGCGSFIFGGLFVFSLLTTTTLLFLHRKWLSAVLSLPLSVAIAWGLSDYVFHISPSQAFKILTPLSRDLTASMNPVSQGLVVMLYVFAPVTVSLIWSGRLLFGKNRNSGKALPQKTKNKKADTLTRLKGVSLGYFKRFVMPVVPVAALAVGLYLTHNKVHRQIVLMNYQARQKQWSNVLETANRLPRHIYNIYCNHDINRALYHTGRLTNDLLCFPQNPHALLLTHEKEESFMTQLIMCDTFMEMGNVDDAERLASEFRVDKGDTGFVLEKLAWINIVKEQEQTAQIYLNALKMDLIYRSKANALSSQLKTGFEPNEATIIHQTRSYRRKHGDAGLYKESIEDMLKGLLEHNPQNKMAFEYLMTYYLLTGQIEKVSVNMGHLENLEYQNVPILYEEAKLLHHASRSQRLNLTKLNIKRETFERYKRFVTLCNSMKQHNRQVVLQQLFQEFGTGYFFFHKFTVTRLASTS